MEKQYQQGIYFRFEGPAFVERGTYIHTAAQSLLAMQNIFDSTYLALRGKKKLSAATRRNFVLVAEEIRQGSLEGHIEIFVAALPLLVQLGGPKAVWEMTKATFDFLRTVFTLIQEPKDARGISIQTGDNSLVIMHNDGIVASYPLPVKDIASDALKKGYQEWASLFRRGEVERIQLGESLTQSAIDITPELADRFYRRKFLAEESVALTVEIIGFDKKRGSGRLVVLPGQEIPAGEYSFVVPQQMERFEKVIRSMLKNRVSIICREEIVLEPLPRIARLHVESVGWKPEA